MAALMERLEAGRVVVCDGAMGTELQARGLPPGACPELWCLDHADEVKAIHRAYREAGSDMVECNSFGASRYKLGHFGLETRVGEINRAAAAIAREAAGPAQVVLGSMGPTGLFMAPLGSTSEEELVDAFAEQAEALEAGGADAVIVETMTALDEALAAVKAVKTRTGLSCIVSLTFDPQRWGGFATMMGIRPADFAAAAVASGADVIGTNCGTGPEDMVDIVREIRAASGAIPLMAMPNAGRPVLEDGRTVFKQSPAAMAAVAPQLVEAGASIVGGCCGTTPEHIRAIRQALG